MMRPPAGPGRKPRTAPFAISFTIPFAIIISFFLMATVFLSIGCLDSGPLSSDDDGPADEAKDRDGDGVPDDEDQWPDHSNWGVNLSYLDDTMHETDGWKQWDVDVCTPLDYGILLVDNVGMEEDTYTIEVVDEPEGWTVGIDTRSMTLDNETIGWTMVRYMAPNDVKLGETYYAQVSVVSKTDPAYADTILLLLTVGNIGARVAETGDQTVISYSLTDLDGNPLDSGTLPATAGEPEAGPAGQVSYITGFYLAILGMYHDERKTVLLPPDLAYGNDPTAHELGGVWLVFSLTLDWLEPKPFAR